MTNNFNDDYLDDYFFDEDETIVSETSYQVCLVINANVLLVSVPSLTETLSFYSTHINFQKASDICLKYVQTSVIPQSVLEELRQLNSIKTTFNKNWSNGDMKIVGNSVTYKGDKIPETLEHFILTAFESQVAFDDFIKPWIIFAQKLSECQSMEVYSNLHNFLKHSDLTVNDNGNVVAYKVINPDFTDIYTGKIDNSVGATVTEDRRKVSSDSNSTCSFGLHACSLNYIRDSGYGGNNKILVKIEVDPRDIVCVPNDYQGTKIRCCKYKVTELLGNWDDVKDLY